MPEIIGGPSQGTSNNYQSFINNNYQKKSKKKFFAFIGIVILIIALPLIILVSRIPQEIRQRASGTNFNINQYISCGTAPSDIMLIFDTSGSMSNSLGNSKVTKLQAAIIAGKTFVDLVAQNTQNHIGLTNFSTTATLDNKMTTNFSSVKSQITAFNANGNTCTECGAKTADDELHTNGRSGFKHIAILLTDGIANTIIGNPNKVGTPAAEAAALTEIQKGYNNDQITYFTIGLGNRDGKGDSGIDEPFLQKIAKITGGQYYYSPTTDDLSQIYQNIATIIGKGSISGTVYNDANNNGIFDSGESGLANWTVNLKDPSNVNLIATTQSAADGSYIFNGICDQSYAVSEVVQKDWTQTQPVPPGYYPVTITNGSIVKGKDFGNSMTSPTPTACVTPDPIQNVQIMCTNCSNGNSSQ